MKNFTKIISVLCAFFFLTNEKSAKAQTDSVFNYTGGFQNWTVPCNVTSITITAYGAQGGSANTNANLGGLGAKIQGTFTVTPSQVLTVVVGSQGTSSGTKPGSGGGGGSGVVYGSTPLIIAGGGGGRDFGGWGDSADANITNTGASGQGNVNGGVAGGNGGNVIYSVTNITYGGNGFNAGNKGDSGTDGVSPNTNITNGSWGLGGGGGGVGNGYCNCGGGGGGYSGGGAGGINGDGGGGSSYNSGTSQVNTPKIESGDGMVVISYNSVTMSDTASVISNVLCNGGNGGSAYAKVAGGSAPYTYTWTPTGGTADTANGLTAGTYTVTVTDSCGDLKTSSVVITQPAALSLVKGSIPAWKSNCNGSAWVTVSGGVKPYKYAWSPGSATSDTAKALCNGTYCCTVTDSNGCIDSACIDVITGIASIDNATLLNIYPNPSNGNFTIAGLTKGFTIEVYNYTGQKISSLEADDETMQFNIANEANGIYLLRILTKDGNFVEQTKILKTN